MQTVLHFELIQNLDLHKQNNGIVENAKSNSFDFGIRVELKIQQFRIWQTLEIEYIMSKRI